MPRPEERPQSLRPHPLLRSLQVLAVALVLGLLALLVWRVVDKGPGAQLVAQIRADKQPPAPQFSLPVIWARAETWPTVARRALADGQLAPRELRGRAVVINFWASWCIPCKDEAPRLAASARAHAGKVAFLGIDVQDFTSDARRFLARFDTPYVSVHSSGSAVYDDYGLTGVPETFWLDARGRIVAHYPGEISRDQLEDGIARAVNGT